MYFSGIETMAVATPQPDTCTAQALVPVCPHRPFTRPLVTGPEVVFRMRPSGEVPGRVSADGRRVAEVSSGGEVRVAASGRTVCLLAPSDEPYYGRLRRKLGWGRTEVDSCY